MEKNKVARKRVQNQKVEKSNRNNKGNKNKFQSVISEYIPFFKENLRKKTIVIYVICLVLFFVFLNMFMSNIDFNEILEQGGKVDLTNNSIFSMIKEKIVVIFLIILSGITPYVYIPVIGIFTSYSFAFNIVSLFGVSNNSFHLIAMSIGAIIQLFGVAIAVAQGMYYCRLSTRKFRYSQTTSFGVNDVKKAIYEIKKDNEKVEQVEKVQQEKIKKQEELNEKVPYKKLAISFVISIVIVIIGTVIARI